MKVRKAVVTAAGWGTRFLPATKAQPKEMLPVVDKPLIQYIVEEAVASGIQQIIVVTALGKRAIEDHFDRSFDLESALRAKGNLSKLKEIKRVSEMGEISYIRQKEQLGLGHAILITENLVGGEPFAVFLPDDLIQSDVPAMAQMVEVFNRYQASVVAVERVPKEATSAYGIVAAEPVGERVFKVTGLVEKPSPEAAPSNLAIVGRYILTPEIFQALHQTGRGKGNEIQLTDGLQLLLKQQPIYAYEFTGKRHDAGTPLGLLKASVEIALSRSDIGPEFSAYLKDVVRWL
ncbi:MAG: UTP--glucose-1-phosphate uridylyltransferase GalU [Dehalococcoidia bacterium]|nr:UTP--glucose-1-phosphate uridylyltransferase GalU [Dehalococcoidia bacterium]